MTAVATMPRRYIRQYRNQSTPASSEGKRLFAMWVKAASHARNNATDWRSLTKSLIEEVAGECWFPNWDGYRAKPISKGAKIHAQNFVDLLPYRLPAPEPVPDPEGDIALSWDFGPDHVFSVSIDESGTLSYAGLLGGGVKRHGMEPFKGDLPLAILESLDELIERSNAGS